MTWPDRVAILLAFISIPGVVYLAYPIDDRVYAGQVSVVWFGLAVFAWLSLRLLRFAISGRLR